MDLYKIIDSVCGTNYSSVKPEFFQGGIDKEASEDTTEKEVSESSPFDLLSVVSEVEDIDCRNLSPLEKISAAAYLLEEDDTTGYFRGIAIELVSDCLHSQRENQGG